MMMFEDWIYWSDEQSGEPSPCASCAGRGDGLLHQARTGIGAIAVLLAALGPNLGGESAVTTLDPASHDATTREVQRCSDGAFAHPFREVGQ